MIRAVLDTNVVFEGFTKPQGDCRLIMDAARVGLFTVCATDAVIYEYIDVLERKLSPEKMKAASIQLADLLHTVEFVTVNYRYRPVSPDPDDDKIIECALNGSAIVVTSNLKDFRSAERKLGLSVRSPAEFASKLAE